MARALQVAIALTASACSQISGLDPVVPVRDAPIDTTIDTPDAACTGATQAPANEGTMHATEPMPVSYAANPPASGMHYPRWAKWNGTYTNAVPRPYWVHNLEHGGVVLLYNCDDCTADVDRLAALMDSLPADTACTTPNRNRLIVTRDTLLPAGVRFAASAWNHTYTADCFNEPELRAFATAHYGPSGEAPESTNCNSGDYP